MRWRRTSVGRSRLAGVPDNSGPGGPILVISSASNPFSRYYGEILSAEGLNEYLVADISTVTSTTLANYDVVILGDMSLTSAQVSMLTTWVNGGGQLIAMHPDKQLAGLLGLTASTSTLSNAYLLVADLNRAGSRYCRAEHTVPWCGRSVHVERRVESRDSVLECVDATTSPAVTLANAGTGQAAAFTYDLARSIVYTRQGNPAWSGQARDGQAGPIRSDDLYFGAASFDPEPDWVDLNKVAIPQADEQQRLLANLILQMNAAKKPLPRFWYFPERLQGSGRDDRRRPRIVLQRQRDQSAVWRFPGGQSGGMLGSRLAVRAEHRVSVPAVHSEQPADRLPGGGLRGSGI